MKSDALLILPDGREHALRDSCTLGRHASNDLQVTSEHASRQHALIQRQVAEQGDAVGFRLVDLGSANGSMVNGRRATRPVSLVDGDEIDLAGYRMRFRFDEAAAALTFGPASTIISVKRRKLWLLITDIIGFTEMSVRLPPEEVPQITGTWFKRCREVVEAQEGHMNQYLGDGFFGYWEDDAQSRDGLRRAMGLFAEMQRSPSPPFRLVLHYGNVVMGSVPTLGTMNLHGPQVNFVFRLEKTAASLGETALLSEAAADALPLAHIRSHTVAMMGFDGTFRVQVPDMEVLRRSQAETTGPTHAPPESR